MKKWVKMITDEDTTVITDIEGLMYLDFKEDDVETITNELTIQGTDGKLLGNNTFGPFNLVLRFVYSGVDISDYHLLKAKLRGMLYKRTPFYIVHSDMPSRKYAVVTDSTAIEDLYGRNGEFEITFTVYKGYSESLYDTDQFSLIDGKWQFESGLVPDNTIKYIHNRSLFDIYNGSQDTINPRYSHRLKIRIQLETDTGFKLVNKATGDVFEYKGTLKANQSFILDGGYAYKDEKRCGRQTNHGIITLAPGYNTFEVWGKISNFEIEFIFPFIYR